MNAPLPPVTYCSLGNLIRTLRREAGFSQELLAQQSGLSADSIRRLEHNAFSPSLSTLKKLCAGLGMSLSNLFTMHERKEPDPTWELQDMLAGRSPEEIRFITDAAKELLAGLGRMHDTGHSLTSTTFVASEHQAPSVGPQ